MCGSWKVRERGKGAFLQLAHRGQDEDAGGQGLEIEGPEDQRRGKFLHAVNEDEQPCSNQGGPQKRQVNFEEGADGTAPQRPRGSGDVGRYLLEPRFKSAEGDGEEAHHIGEDDGRDRA